MANGGRIDFTVGFKTDTSGLNQIKSSLTQLKELSATDILNLNPNLSGINEAKSVMMKLRESVSEVETAFQTAFDPTTGVTNITTLSHNLQKLDLSKISANFSKIGAQGITAFSQIAAKSMTTNLKFKETNNLLDKMGKTLGNTIKWSVASSLVNTFSSSIQQAYGYVQHLDTSLNDIRIVTGKSSEEMDKFAQKANEAASSLGAATTEYTEAALIYYQQGLSDKEANARAETTVKAANVTGQSAQQVSEELTAVWNGYKVSAEETELYVDKLAAVAATTASDLEELSTGMSKVASAANNMGVDVDQLNAQLSTIISVTRQAPETAGTALKTIYARMEDLKISGEDEDGVKLGEVSSTLDEVGVHVMDTAGNLRDLGEVIEEVGNKWETWTDAQQSAIAQAIAGKRQYNNLLALFDNWDMYNSALETSSNATGTLQNQQDIYMQSTAAHIQKLTTQWEDLYDSLLNADTINTVSDMFTSVLDKVTNFIDSIGGGKGALLGLGAVATTVFNKQISQGLESIITKFGNAKYNAQALEAELQTTAKYFKEIGASNEAVDEIVQLKQHMQQYYDVMSNEEIEAANALTEEASKVIILKQQWKMAGEELEDYTKKLASSQVGKNSTFKTSGDTSQYTKLQSSSFTDDTFASIGQKAIDNAVNAANELETAFEKAKISVQDYQAALKSGDEEAQEEAMNRLVQAYQEYESAENKFIVNANIEEKEQDELAERYNKVINKIKRLIEVYNDPALSSKRAGSTGAVTKALNQEETAVKKLTSSVKEMGNKFNEELPKIKEEFQKCNAETEKFKTEIMSTQALDMRQLVSGISSLVSGITSVGFAFSSISSISKTWADDTLSGAEKIFSTMTSLGMILPGLISAYKGLNSVKIIFNTLTSIEKINTGELMVLQGTAISTIAAQTVARKLLTDQLQLFDEELAEAAIKELAETGTLSQNTTATIINTAAKKGNVEATNLLNSGTVMASGSLAQFTKMLQKVKSPSEVFHALSGKLTTGFKSFASALGLTTGALTALLVVIGLVIAIAVKYYNHLKNVREAEASAAEARADAARKYTESLEEEKTKVDELVSSYKSLKEQYEDHSISLQTLKEEVYDLTIQYGYEDLALKALTESYESLTKAMAEYQIQANKDLIEAQNKEKDSLQDKIGSSIWRDAKETARDEIVTYELDENGKSIAKEIDTLDLKGFGVKNKDEEELARGLQDLGINVYDNGHIDYEQFIEVLTENRDELQAVINKSSSEAAAQLQEYIDNSSADLDRYEELTESVLTKEEQNRGLILEQSDVKSYEDAQKAYKEYMQTATEVDGLTWEEAQAQFIKYANIMDNTFMQEEAKRQLLKDKMESEYLIAAKANNIDTSDWDIHEQTEQFINELLNSGFSLDDISLITEEQWHKLYLGELNLEDIKTEIEEETRQNLEQIRNDFLNNDVEQFNIDLNSVISDMVSGDLSADDETYVALSEQLKSIKEAFPELTDEATIFLQEGLIGTEEWAEAAYSLQDAFDQLEFQHLNDKLDDAFEELKKFTNEGQYDENGVKINVDADTDDFQDAIENVLNAEYAIDVKLYTDGVQEFEDLEESMQDIDTMASKIGEDFIVAADDIRELNNTFPGILEGMEYLADGTVQLNEEVVESAMDAATAEETTSANTTATKLENTATELRAKADMYDDMADLAEDAANGEADVQEQKQKIINQLNQLETENDQKVADSEIDNSHAVVDDSAENAPILAENWTKAYEEAAQSANDWATLATAANKAVANGEDWNADEHKGDFAVNFTGSKSKTTTSTTVAKVQNADQSTMKDIANTFRNTATTYRKNANDLEGAAAELRAKSLNSANTNSNVGTKTSSSNNDSTDSSNDPDTEDYLERTTDLYREINEELDDIESTLGRIQTIDEHSWGASSLAALKEENSLLEEQYDLLTKKKDTYESDLSSQRQSLENQGITFSQDGSVMTNAESKLNTLYAEYNTMVDSYNSMTADEQETYKSTLEAKKETIEDLEDAIDKYEDSYNDYNDVLDELLDTHYELIENAVNQFNAEIDVKLELDEAEDAWNDFWYDVVQDIDDTDFSGKIAKSIDKLNTYVGQLTGTESSQISSLTDHLNDTITEVNKQIEGANKGGGDSIFKDDTALSKETLTNYRDKLITAVKTAKEEIDSIVENYLNILDEAQDKIDKQVEGWESINDHIEHNLSLIKKVSGSKAYEALNKQFNQQYEANLQLVDVQKQSVDYWKERMSYYQQMMATENEGSKMYNMYSESLKKASENYKDAVKDLDKSIEDAIGDLEEWRENQVSAIEDAFERSISKEMGLDLMSEEWDLAIDKQEYYLDNIEKAIELESLQNDFKDALNGLDARNEKQKELLAFMDEENKKLQEKNKLTQYDIDEVKARLEIKKAELALEEAQKNKSNLRLRRDSQGNYSYQYTADTDQIEESESGVLSAKKAWYDLVKQRNKETREYIQEQLKTLYSDMEAYNQALADNDYEKAENIKKLIEERRAYILELTSESEKAQRDMFQGTAQIFADTTTAQMLPMWSTALAEMTEKWAGDGSSSFTGAVTQAIEDLQAVQEAFANKTEKILEKAGVNYENLVENGIDPTTKSLNDMQDSNEKLNESLKETNSTLSTLQDNLKTTIDAYNDLKDAAVNAINDANDALNTLANTTVKQVNQIKTAVNTINNANNNNNNNTNNTNNNNGNSSNNNNGNNNNGTNTEKTGTRKRYTITRATTKLANGTTGVIIFDNKQGYTISYPSGNRLIGASGTNYSAALTDEKIDELNLEKYRSGGYTGDWNRGISTNEDGRLAVLHQKELVLNQSDTSNMLKMIQAVRDIVQLNHNINASGFIDSFNNIGQMQSSVLSKINSDALQAIASTITTNNSETQNYKNMTVNADFSGVRSADAIYQALVELENYGMQQAYSNAPNANIRY